MKKVFILRPNLILQHIKYSVLILICFLVTSVAFAEPPAKIFRIRVNKGQPHTNTKSVLLELQLLKPDAKVSSMMITFDPKVQKEWVKFQTSIPVELEGGDGRKIVYVVLKDDAGNMTEPETATVVLDTQPPKNCTVQINEGAEYTIEKNLMVKLAFSAEEAQKMQVSNNESFTNAVWENFVGKKIWTLQDRADGVKYVFARFMDAAGNVGEIVYDSIIQDLTPPTGTVVINDNEKFAQGRLVYLTIKTNDAVEVRIVGQQSRVVPFQKRLESHDYMLQEWWLDSLEGKKAVKVFFKDKAGNISTIPAIDDIILDSQDPEKPAVSLDNGAKFTTNATGKAILRIVLKENPANFRMQVGHDPEFKDITPIPYTAVIQAWQLDASSDGQKDVYVKVYDEAGNYSETAVATIILDRKTPISKSLIINDGDKFTVKRIVNLKLEAEGADFMQISNIATFPGAVWIPYASEKNDWAITGNEGVNFVYVRYKDEAGNISTGANSSIVVDTKAPSGVFSINSGRNITNQQEVKLSLTSKETDNEMQISNNANFDDAKWQPHSQTIEKWRLEGEDGPKVVFARLRDQAGNISASFSAKITLDKTSPQNSKIVINNDSIYTKRTDKKVKLHMTAAGADFMRTSHTPEFKNADWEPFKLIKEVTLEGKDGEKVIYAQFKDKAENVSETVSDKIILDTEPPVAGSIVINNGDAFTNNKDKKVSLKIEAEDAVEMRIYQDGFITKAKWLPYAKTVDDFLLQGTDGAKVIYVQFKDEAGNVSQKLKGQINLKLNI